MKVLELGYEDALKGLIRWMRHPNDRGHGKYGYDVFLPNVIRDFLITEHKMDSHNIERSIRALSPVFFNAAWDLCRRGILRPGENEYGAQAVPGLAGYSITPFGLKWLSEADNDD